MLLIISERNDYKMIQRGMDTEFEKVMGSDWVQEQNDYDAEYSNDFDCDSFDFYDSPIFSESDGINLEGLLGLFYDHF